MRMRMRLRIYLFFHSLFQPFDGYKQIKLHRMTAQHRQQNDFAIKSQFRLSEITFSNQFASFLLFS